MLESEEGTQAAPPSRSHAEPDRDDTENNTIHFKGNRIYQHNIMRINYTMYDVRRAQDVINPKTDQQNVMLLSFEEFDPSRHQYSYARVLGIFHVYVIYTGRGMLDYKARRMEFLWVRWYDILDDVDVDVGWRRARLDRLHFPPMDEEGSFGFIDPTYVLRACHLMPSLAAGRHHPEGGGISPCAQNSNDWHEYFVNR